MIKNTIKRDENQMPVIFTSKVTGGTVYSYDIRFVGNWREGLRKVFDDDNKSHILKCIKLKGTTQDDEELIKHEPSFTLGVKYRVLMDMVNTISDELSVDMSFLNHLFEGVFKKDEIPQYLSLVHDMHNKKEANLYQQAKVKYLVQTLFDMVEDLDFLKNPSPGNENRSNFPDDDTSIVEVPF
jgi:hypothetical protein